jgi:hypothetical protein
MSGSESTPGRTGPRRQPCVEILDPMVVEILRRKTPAERVAMILDANRAMRLRLEGHLRSVHPDWDAASIQQEIARRMSRGAS